jgi:hypothetical protein
MKAILLTLIFFPILSFSQCDWKTFFPFEIGDNKFEISKKKSLDSTIVDYQRKTNLHLDLDYSKYDSYKVKYDYLTDSVQINRVRLEYQKNICFKNDTELDLFLANDKLYKAEISLIFDDYNEMLDKYDFLIDNVPKRYEYAYKNTSTNPDTNEKIGEGYVFAENNYEGEDINEVWTDYLSITYSFTYERKWDDEKKKFYYTNKIKEYELEFKLVDLRNVILTRNGY